jgi:hypothetical protein
LFDQNRLLNPHPALSLGERVLRALDPGSFGERVLRAQDPDLYFGEKVLGARIV